MTDYWEGRCLVCGILIESHGPDGCDLYALTGEPEKVGIVVSDEEEE